MYAARSSVKCLPPCSDGAIFLTVSQSSSASGSFAARENPAPRTMILYLWLAAICEEPLLPRMRCQTELLPGRKEFRAGGRGLAIRFPSSLEAEEFRVWPADRRAVYPSPLLPPL